MPPSHGPFPAATRLMLAVAVLVGCGERVPPPPAPTFDAGPRHDAGGMDAQVVRRDGGRDGPRIDGEIDEDEWAGAAEASVDVQTDRDGSVLTRLLATVVDRRLVVGLELSLAEGDSVVLYVDGARGDGRGLESASELADTDVPLDAVLSRELTLPDDIALDAAWGSVGLSRVAPGFDPEMGWRDISTDPSAFVWLGETGGAPSACSASACEAAIELDWITGDAPRTIALFARIVHADGTLTNQTLPMDDAESPATVSALLEVSDGALTPDAGPDAGPADAGPEGIVIDGVLGPNEWESVPIFRDPTTTTGVFAGDSMTGLRVVRDAERLYFALSGRVSGGHAFAVYVDHDLGGGDGLASPAPLDDLSGALDRALTKTLFTPAEVRLDAAWGTLDMNRVGFGNDDRMGWRDIGSNPAAFAPLNGQSACGPNVCEASITLTELGVLPGDSLALFARLVDGQSDVMSRVTLPMNAGGAPDFVATYVTATAP